jgi:hypothetical protein
MTTVIVLLAALALIVLVLYWSTRHGVGARDAGISLKRGRSSHTTMTGRPKVPYATRDEAAAIARRLAARDGVTMSVYRCPTCARWHVGHDR